jgi:hypothetical protein
MAFRCEVSDSAVISLSAGPVGFGGGGGGVEQATNNENVAASTK